jgi:hypothetical protein
MAITVCYWITQGIAPQIADYELSTAADTSGGFPVQNRQFC